MSHLTPHERNLIAIRKRAEKEAAIPGLLDSAMREMEADFAARFLPRNFDPDRLDEFTDWLQSWLRGRFPDLDSMPQIAAQLDDQDRRRIGFPGLRTFLDRTIREQELGLLATLNLQPTKGLPMIPTFLHSLAGLLRQLIAQGRAVHCTEADAAELELLAGLPWDKCVYGIDRSEIFGDEVKGGTAIAMSMQRATPADIALGWLKASQAAVVRFRANNGQEIDCAFTGDVMRAAVRAELAFMSMILLPRLGEIRNDDLPAGRPEGARAAWNFIQSQLQPPLNPIISSQFGMVALRSSNADLEDLARKYRRELEAMK